MPSAFAHPETGRYLNRELSLLDFQERVLALATRDDLPLLERAKFVGIVANNLDEFFQVRVAGLQEQVRTGVSTPTFDGLMPREQLAAIRDRVADLNRRMGMLFDDTLRPLLAKESITIVDWRDLDVGAQAFLHERFELEMFPVLTPLAVDPSHPFPYISNLSLNLAVLVRNPEDDHTKFARVKVPPLLERFVALPDGERFVPVEQVIAAHLDQLFPGMEIIEHSMFRVTRNADYAIEEEEANDLLEAMESVLRFRQRAARAVRLEVGPRMTDRVLDLLLRELELGPEEVYRWETLLDLSDLLSLYSLDRPDLKYPTFTPTTQARIAHLGEKDVDFFAAIRSGDLLVHHPYESFATSTAAFVAQAAADPDVLAIKQTLYRTSAPQDPEFRGEETIVESLIEAAEAGKQVVVLVELKARFDEAANISWAKMLENAGVHVVYGVPGLKTHAKVLLVVRREDGGVRRYAHIGTGNYNPKTARIYEDLALLTADPEIGADLSDLFNVLTGYGKADRYRRLLVAPHTLRKRITARIREEATRGDAGRIVWKLNHLVDQGIIEELYEASQRGTKIDLVVRGMCSLRPGVPGMSETIRVRSIVGKYLEHSRVYRFGSPDNGAVYYMGSSDMMTRNLDHRVEALVPVTDPRLKFRLEQMLEIELADDVLAWEMQPDGSWRKVPTELGIDTHERLEALALDRARGVES